LVGGRLGIQLLFGLIGMPLMFVLAMLAQLALTRRRGALRVPACGDDALLQAGYYVLNGPLEEAFFRGLLQGGSSLVLTPFGGFCVATAAYVLYHRLGSWTWADTFATALAGVPFGLAFWLLPGPASIVGVSLAHIGATCGFLGPGPYLLRRLRLL
jgi:membrane protease YdiL (CAAX protease family)